MRSRSVIDASFPSARSPELPGQQARIVQTEKVGVRVRELTHPLSFTRPILEAMSPDIHTWTPVTHRKTNMLYREAFGTPDVSRRSSLSVRLCSIRQFHLPA